MVCHMYSASFNRGSSCLPRISLRALAQQLTKNDLHISLDICVYEPDVTGRISYPGPVNTKPGFKHLAVELKNGGLDTTTLAPVCKNPLFLQQISNPWYAGIVKLALKHIPSTTEPTCSKSNSEKSRSRQLASSEHYTHHQNIDGQLKMCPPRDVIEVC